ncbi:MAG TPA: hypothetical protein VMO26_04375 [Vicinamibacterales bacterium]|nr:hypothetical protein [Vicinamibacterales bacterium]
MTYPAPALVAFVVAITACALPQSSAAQTPEGAVPAPSRQDGVNEYGAATKAFLDRLQEYRTFHNNVEKMVPRLTQTASPEEIAKREAAFGAMLIKQRPDAKEGDFFIKEYQPHLIKIIRDDFAKRPIVDRKALLVELPRDVKIGVNMIYPTALPLATFPGKLLKALPELPKGLEYRIVGQHLILRDVTGNVIVDILRNVFPIPR